MFNFLKRSTDEPEREPKTREAMWVCIGEPCKELGGRSLLKQVRAAVSRRGLQRDVRVREAACLALCGAGPNLKVMPDRVRYWECEQSSIDKIIDEHFTDPGRPALNPGGDRVEEGTVVKAPR
jgi:(2Fe-2S) ferredoxin